MNKYTIALIMILSFLITSKLIYEEKFYRFNNGVVKIQLTEQQYYKLSNKSVRQIEKEYDYMMGGIISISLGLLLIGYNHFKKNNPTV
jgi:dolichol kinase